MQTFLLKQNNTWTYIKTEETDCVGNRCENKEHPNGTIIVRSRTRFHRKLATISTPRHESMKPVFGLGKTRRFDFTSSSPRDLMSTSRGCLRQVSDVTFPALRVGSFGMFFSGGPREQVSSR